MKLVKHIFMCVLLFWEGAVTYRVVQVATGDGTESQAQVVSATGFPAGAQVIPLQYEII